MGGLAGIYYGHYRGASMIQDMVSIYLAVMLAQLTLAFIFGDVDDE